MTQDFDIQYGSEVAGVYDPVLVSALTGQDTVETLGELFGGKKVLDIGVGSGRIAIPLCAKVAEVTGVDNSADMLDLLNAKSLPANLRTYLTDFRSPLPFEDESFEGAYSTLGSLACVRNVRELSLSLNAVARVLSGGSYFLAELYNPDAYRALATRGRTESRTGSKVSWVISDYYLEGQNLTVKTSVFSDEGSSIASFAEEVLLVSPESLREVAHESGFDVVGCDRGTNFGSIDMWLFWKR